MSLSRRSFVQTLGAGAPARGSAAAASKANDSASPRSTPRSRTPPADHGSFCPATKTRSARRNPCSMPCARRSPRPAAAIRSTNSMRCRRRSPTSTAWNRRTCCSAPARHRCCGPRRTCFARGRRAWWPPIPAYEECADYAALMGYPVNGVKLNAELKMDLDAMLGAAKGQGMVFYCNPNNPVATCVGGKATRDFIAALHKASPDHHRAGGRGLLRVRHRSRPTRR